MSSDSPDTKSARILGADALALLGSNREIELKQVAPWHIPDLSPSPQAVTNWGFFDGAVLGVGLRSDRESKIVGSAAMIAPGLAVTAAHVFRDEIPELEAGYASIFVTGMREDCLDYWGVRDVSYAKNEEIAYISLELRSEPSTAWSFARFGISTRCPEEGEVLRIVGSRYEIVEMAVEGSPNFGGHLYAACGEVQGAYFPYRIGTRPYPVMALGCEALGGMSGGPVVDAEGLLLGVISRSLEGQTEVAWILGGLNRVLNLPWPAG